MKVIKAYRNGNCVYNENTEKFYEKLFVVYPDDKIYYSFSEFSNNLDNKYRNWTPCDMLPDNLQFIGNYPELKNL